MIKNDVMNSHSNYSFTKHIHYLTLVLTFTCTERRKDGAIKPVLENRVNEIQSD